MSVLSERRIKSTRKRCRCAWCNEPIEQGAESWAVAAIFDGDFNSNRFHPECYAAWHRTDWRRFEDSWETGEQQRGKALQEEMDERKNAK